MTLLAEITALNRQDLVDAKEHGQLANLLSIGRTKPKTTKIGEGSILSALGVATGNVFLDVINSVADYRHVKKIISRGDFDVSDLTSRGGIQALVPSVLTQEQANSLLALGTEPATVTVQEVITAMEGL